MAGGAELEEALAAFYRGTTLPSVVEKTMAANFPYHNRYVLSTLNVSSYAGSYPAVDHEFQIKGRWRWVRRPIWIDFFGSSARSCLLLSSYRGERVRPTGTS